MSSPEGYTDADLTGQVGRLTARVFQLEQRLALLENRQSPAAALSPLPLQQPEPPQPLAQSSAPSPVPPAPAKNFDEQVVIKPVPRPAPRSEGAPPGPRNLESNIGLAWINRIGVVTLIIGVAFFFKYAIDNQWVGETGRVALGVLAGLAVLAGAEVFFRRAQAVFAQGISALGVSILYLSFYASYGFYHLIPQVVAFLLMVLVTTTAGALALRYNAMPIAVLSMIGGYLTPLLLSSGHDAPWFFFGYLLLIDSGTFWISRLRRWWALQAIALAATAALYAIWWSTSFRTEKQLVATVAALAFYALFTFAEWPAIFYLAHWLTAIALTLVWPAAVPYLAMSLLLAAAGLYVAERPGRIAAAASSFSAFWATYAFWRFAGYRVEHTGAVFALLTVAFVLYLAWIWRQLLARRMPVQTPHLLILGLDGALYFSATYYLLEPRYHSWLGLFAVATAGVYLLLSMRLWNTLKASAGDTRPVVLALGIASGLLTLAVPIQFSGFRITLAWAVEAAVLAWIGRRMNDRRLWFAAAAIYLFVLFRLFLLDAVALPDRETLLFNARFLTFTVAAAAYALGAWYMRQEQRLAAGAYITGHVVFLSGLLMELYDWILRAAAPENQPSLTAIGVSILLAAYAVALIAAGVVRRFPLNRWLGVGLMSIVVVKLYFYDVWEVSKLFRMTAFVALGILLLLASYLYSRLRPVVQGWWKDEPKESE